MPQHDANNLASHDAFRRRFLQAALGAPFLLAACGGGNAGNAGNTPAAANNAPEPDDPPVVPALRGTVMGPGRAPHPETGKMVFFLGLLDLDKPGGNLRVADDIGFFGHGISPNPVKPGTAVIFEKHGKGSCEVDLLKVKVTRRIKTVADREFYGHGAFTPDGKTLFAAEAIVGDGSYDGVIAVRDGESFELQGEFPTFGIAPHDCHLVDDGRTLVITNGGAPLDAEGDPCISYVDIKSREMRQKLVFRNKRINAGHIAITGKGEVACVSAPRGGIADKAADWLGSIHFYDPARGSMTEPDDPILGKMRGETLSVAIHEPSMIVGATNPSADLLTFWDFRTGKLVKSIQGEFKWPRGISCTLDRKFFVVTYDTATSLILIDAQTLEPVASSKVPESYISGSHNLVYQLPA